MSLPEKESAQMAGAKRGFAREVSIEGFVASMTLGLGVWP
jgi:hypothetical protein